MDSPHSISTRQRIFIFYLSNEQGCQESGAHLKNALVLNMGILVPILEILCYFYYCKSCELFADFFSDF